MSSSSPWSTWWSTSNNTSSAEAVITTRKSTPLSTHLASPYVSIPLSCSLVLGASFTYARFLRRIPTAAYITPRTLKRKRIRGYVTSIGDADGFRLYHRPGPWFLQGMYPIPTDKKQLRDQTISVRLAGADAPEVKGVLLSAGWYGSPRCADRTLLCPGARQCAHFGKPAQPFSAEAQTYLTSMVLNRSVTVELLSKDHYGRAVGMVWVRKPALWPFKSNVSLEMVKRGLATVYTQAGAEYGSTGKNVLVQAEAKAR